MIENEIRQKRVQMWMKSWVDSLDGQWRLPVRREKWDHQYRRVMWCQGIYFKIDTDFIKLIYAHGYKAKLYYKVYDEQ